MTRAQSTDALSQGSNESDVGMGLQLVVHSNGGPHQSVPTRSGAGRPTSPLNPRRTVSLGTHDLEEGGAANAALRRVRHQHQYEEPMQAAKEQEVLGTSHDSSTSLQRNDESTASFQSRSHRRPRSRKHTALEDEFGRNVEQEKFYLVPPPAEDEDDDVFRSNPRLSAVTETSDVVLELNQADLDKSLAPVRIAGGMESVV